MEKQDKLYLWFSALCLTTGIVMTAVDLRQTNSVTHFTVSGYVLAALFFSLFMTSRRGLFKATICLGCILASVLVCNGILLILKADNLSLRLFRIVTDLLFYYGMWTLFLKTPWNNMRGVKH